MDERYAYISTEMAGYIGNILVIYGHEAIRQRVEEVSRWWLPGQHPAPAADSRAGPAASIGCTTRCASAERCGPGAGMASSRVIDVSGHRHGRARSPPSTTCDPPFPEPTHAVMPLPFQPGGRRICVAIDEETSSTAPPRPRRGAS